MRLHPFNCCGLSADFLSPAELRGWDGLWEYLMTSVLPSQAVSFLMWSLSNPCRLLAHICWEATYIVMCLEWQIALFSPRGIVDFSQEGCLLLKMRTRLGWLYPLPPVFPHSEKFIIGKSWAISYPIRPLTPQRVKCNNGRIDYMWST